MSKSTRQLGILAENLACQYLQRSGVIILAQNYHCKFGEIDIIGLEKKTLLFIEVKYRSHDQFGHGLESITQRKQQAIQQCAANYLHSRRLTNSFDSRFDAISVSNSLKNPVIEWIQNAFCVV